MTRVEACADHHGRPITQSFVSQVINLVQSLDSAKYWKLSYKRKGLVDFPSLRRVPASPLRGATTKGQSSDRNIASPHTYTIVKLAEPIPFRNPPRHMPLTISHVSNYVNQPVVVAAVILPGLPADAEGSISLVVIGRTSCRCCANPLVHDSSMEAREPIAVRGLGRRSMVLYSDIGCRRAGSPLLFHTLGRIPRCCTFRYACH